MKNQNQKMDRETIIRKIKKVDKEYLDLKYELMEHYSDYKLEKMLNKSLKKLEKLTITDIGYDDYVNGTFGKFFFEKTGVKLTAPMMHGMDFGLLTTLCIQSVLGTFAMTPKMVDFLNKYSTKGKYTYEPAKS